MKGWIAAVVLGVYATGMTVGYVAAARYAQTANGRLEAAERLDVKAADVFRPLPEARTVDVFGAPYNVTITCTVEGSALRNGGRVPLDLGREPLPGDVYRKTCRAS